MVAPAKLWVRLRDCRRGASLIEFGLALPVLCFLVMGMADLATGISARFSLEQAAYRTLEKVTVGSSQTDYSYLAAEAATAASVPVSNVTVNSWRECNQVRQTVFDGTCPTGQMTSSYVQIVIVSAYHPFFQYGPLGTTFGARQSDGNIPISGSAAVRIQ
jgi:Flp pilus assembly protein TadG